MGVAVLCFMAASLVAAPARASDMGMVVPMLFSPLNVLAAMIVAPFGIPGKGRPGTFGNVVAAATALFVGVPGFFMACVSLSYLPSDYDNVAKFNLVAYALLVAALTFTIRSRSRQLEASMDED